jgi:hypothetical protein
MIVINVFHLPCMLQYAVRFNEFEHLSQIPSACLDGGIGHMHINNSYNTMPHSRWPTAHRSRRWTLLHPLKRRSWRNASLRSAWEYDQYSEESGAKSTLMLGNCRATSAGSFHALLGTKGPPDTSQSSEADESRPRSERGPKEGGWTRSALPRTPTKPLEPTTTIVLAVVPRYPASSAPFVVEFTHPCVCNVTRYAL